MDKVRLSQLSVGSMFRKCMDGNTYIKTNQKNQLGEPLCTNLDTGKTYHWNPYELVYGLPERVKYEILYTYDEEDTLPNIPPQKAGRKKFWMCFVDGKDVPKYQHWNKLEAKTEAERLAKTTGYDVFLLEATWWVRIKPPVPPAPLTVWKETI